MPLVEVDRDPKVVTDEILKPLVDGLPEMVASTLTCDDADGHLTPEDIKIRVRDFGPYDKHHYDVEVIILANFYPQRGKTLELRRRVICNEVKYLLRSKVHGFVWVNLTDGSFGEF